MSSVRTPGAGTAQVHRAPVPERPTLHQIVLPTPWEIGPVQVYVIDGDPLTLVDTGVRTPESWSALETAFDSLGRGLDEIQRVILTHYHEDHLGQVESLRRHGADFEVWAHDAETPMIESYTPERDERIDDTAALFGEYGVPADLLVQYCARVRNHLETEKPISEATRVDHPVHDGDSIEFKDFELKVVHAPGHTAGHLLLHEPSSGSLITGDHIMGSAVPFTDNYYVGAIPDARDPMRQRPRFHGLTAYQDSLRRLRRTHFETILPAHGGIVRRPDRAIEDALLFYDVRVQRIERGLRTLAAMGQDVTGWEIWKALFPKADPLTQMRNRMLMVIGAIDVLQERGVCQTERRDDGVLVHRSSGSTTAGR